MSDADNEVVMISSDAGESGIGDYVEDLTNHLSRTHIDNVTIPMDSNNPAIFAKLAIDAGVNDSNIVHVQHEYGQFGTLSLMSLVFFPVLYITATFTQKPIVITMHEGLNGQLVTDPIKSIKQLYVSFLNTIITLDSNQVIFLSEQTAEELEQSVTANQSTTLHHGVPTERCIDISKAEAKERLGYNSDDVLITEPGFIEPRKGNERFARLAERLPDYEFIIGGGASGPSYQEYVNQIERRAPRNLTITGRLDKERFHLLFLASDLIILPYKNADQGGVINTTNQSGILNRCATYGSPVLTSDLPYFRAIEQEWNAIMTCDFSNLNQAEYTVQELIDYPQKRSDLSNSIATYAQEHSFDQIAERHERIYNELCAP